MRKKSHISVAKGVISGLDINERIHHKLSFYVGSIWPDCVPSFITRRHCIEETFDIFIKKMEKFVRRFNPKKDMGMMSTWRMGVVLHYIADYFTFPHNTNYKGSLKEHCAYEETLKHRMYRYVEELKEDKQHSEMSVLPNIRAISDFIMEKHEQYAVTDSNVDQDCRYSVFACMCVVASLLNIVSKNRAVNTAAAAV